VNPDQVIVLNITRDSLGKQTVDFLVGVPGRFVKGNLTWVIVKESPKNFV